MNVNVFYILPVSKMNLKTKGNSLMYSMRSVEEYHSYYYSVFRIIYRIRYDDRNVCTFKAYYIIILLWCSSVSSVCVYMLVWLVYQQISLRSNLKLCKFRSILFESWRDWGKICIAEYKFSVVRKLDNAWM